MTAIDIAPGKMSVDFPAAGRAILATVLRYGISTAGPLAVSAAHFLASLLLLRQLNAHEFGLFSFVMVVVSFGMSASAAMIVVPLTQALASGADNRVTCFKMNTLICTGFGTLLFTALAASGASLVTAAVLGLYGAAFAWRWFARNTAYIDGRIGAAIASDFTYAAALAGGLILLLAARRMTFAHSGEILLAAALLAAVPFGGKFLAAQVRALRHGRLRDYLPIFRQTSRWTVLGVALTEVSVNAHAYLVTFLAGPGAFALLALGTLLMRPAALVQSALPDLERPAMARAIAAHDLAALKRTSRAFSWALAAALAGTVLLVGLLMAFAPQLVLKKGYDLNSALIVLAASALITGLRGLRTPPAVWLQAAGAFKTLARIGMATAAVAVVSTAILLLAFGPIESLGGIMLSEAVMILALRRKLKDWIASHG